MDSRTHPGLSACVVGGGVAGLTCAVQLAEQGVSVQVLERGEALGTASCGWYAGGMLAPWCELEAEGEPWIAALGEEGLAWWRARLPTLSPQDPRSGAAGYLAPRGTLVVAAGRDLPELERFAARTQGYRWLEGEGIATLEPDLAGRFERALYFADEAHLDPRSTLGWLAARLASLGGQLRLGITVSEQDMTEAVQSSPHHWCIDCRGLGARTACPDLRGVRGEMLLVASSEIQLHRPVRLLHPRWPLYVVPRGEGIYMVGATMLESDDIGPVTLRSALELLGATYALHPSFAEARLLELGAQARPAFADNRPRVQRCDRLLRVNGLFRHGFLIAPSLARRASQIVLDCAAGADRRAQAQHPATAIA